MSDMVQYSNLDSEVGLKEPARKRPYVDIRTHTETWTEDGWRYIGTRYTQAATKKVTNDIQLFTSGREPERVKIVPVKDEVVKVE